jgi:tRNA(fMet)-specific endonuclease VapC
LIYMLDTNVISHVVKQSPGWDRIAANYDKARRAGSQLTMSIMSVYEIRKGLLLGESGKAKMKMTTRANMGLMMGSFQWFNFDGYAAESAARVAADLKRAGQPIGEIDTLIAGHALAVGATVVTHNTKDFSRVPGLTVVDWTQ